MAERVLMTALSPTMEEGTIVAWNKKEGSAVSPGDVLCEVETDKATMDYESTQEGTLLKIIRGDGTTTRVGEIIAILGEEGEDIAGLMPRAQDTAAEDTA
ncbi:MAG: 2-oxo acid dehydrogenase subunit E2, partial [Spirochaetaceae bacterium]|nr:2-oxo acid dehydrogenase subunit E2 [Spirochaetaceae bacterium]